MAERLDIVVKEKGAKIVKRRLAEIGTGARKAASGVRVLQSALLGIGATVGLLAAINTIKNFEQAMSSVRAVVQATEREFRDLTDVARQLGATTRFSATDAAEGMLFLARAGFDAAESMEAIGATLNLAQAGALELGRAADIASNVLTAFGLATNETNRVVDVLALSANSANTTVNQLGDGLKLVAPIAAGVGIELEETTAVISALSDAGLQATLAGTGLRKIISSLLAPTPKATALLKKFGLSADDVDVSTVGLTESLERLIDAGIGAREGLVLFGVRGGPAFSVLVKNIPKVKELTAAFKDAEGTAERIAVIMDSNLNGALLSVRSAFEALVLSISDFNSEVPSIEEVQSAIDKLEQELADGVLTQDQFNLALRQTLTQGKPLTNFFFSLADGVRFVANNLEDLRDAIFALSPAILLVFRTQFVGAVKLATAAVLALSAAIATNPIGALVVGISTATSAMVFFNDEITVSEDGVVNLGDVGNAVFQLLGEKAEEAAGLISESFKESVSNAIDFIDDIEFSFEGFGEFIVTWADRVLGTIIGLNKAILAAFRTLVDPVTTIFQTVFNGIIRVINSGLNKIIEAENELRDFFGLDLVDPVKIKELEVKAEGSFRSAGEAIKEAFLEGFEATVIADTVETVMVRAREIAEDRIKEAAVPDPIVDPGIPDPKPDPSGTGTTVNALRLTEDEIAVLEEKRAAVQDLLNGIDLLRGTEAQLTAAEDVLKFAVQDGTISAQEKTEALGRLERELVGVGNATQDYEDKIELLNSALGRGVISTEEFKDETRDLRIALLDTQTDLASGFERTFLKMERDAEDAAQNLEDALTDAFDVASDALSDFVKTGKLSLSDLAGDLSDILIKFGLQSLTGAITGGFGGAAISPTTTSAAIGDTGRFLDFAHGGSFNVDGNTGSASSSPGEDRFVGLNLRKGERVTVDPAGGSPGGGTVNLTQVFPGISDVDALGRNRGQINQRAFRTGQIVAARNRA